MLERNTRGLRLWAFDTETGLIQPGLLAPQVVCLSCSGSDCVPDLMLHEQGFALLVQQLQDPNILLIGHNVSYDFGVMCAQYPELLPLVFQAYIDGRVSDTMIREKLLDLSAGKLNDGSGGANARRSYSMADLWERYTGQDISEDKKNPNAWRLRYSELEGVPVEQWPFEAAQYAKDDAVRTVELWRHQIDLNNDVNNRNGNELRHRAIRPNGRVVNEEETVASAWVLHLMGMWGVRTNGPKIATLNDKLTIELERSKVALLRAGILKYKKGSGGETQKDLGKIRELIMHAYQSAGSTPPTTDKGGVSTAKETLLDAPTAGQPQQMLERADGTSESVPVLQILAGISAIEHNLNTYVSALVRGTSVPITPRWKELVASGRTACEKPNLQNLPRDGGWRECLAPRKGCVFVNADYTTIELRALAQTCIDWFGYSRMADAMNDNVDPHLLLASDILGIPYEDAVARKKDKEVKSARQMSKAANFGYPGGLGAASFASYAKASYKVLISEQEAKRLKNLWLSRWPEMGLYFQRINRNINAGQIRMTEDGPEKTFQLEQPVSGRLRGGAGYCDGCNSYFQGRTADGAKWALFCVTMEAILGYSPLWPTAWGVSPLYGYHPVILAHDEIVLEGSEEPVRATAAADRLSHCMVEAMQEHIPDIVILAEPAIMRLYSKDAESIRQEDGTLSIWEPK